MSSFSKIIFRKCIVLINKSTVKRIMDKHCFLFDWHCSFVHCLKKAQIPFFGLQTFFLYDYKSRTPNIQSFNMVCKTARRTNRYKIFSNYGKMFIIFKSFHTSWIVYRDYLCLLSDSTNRLHCQLVQSFSACWQTKNS